MTTVLKLGGSVITAKDRPETLDDTRLSALADAMASAREAGDVDDLVVVHGGGSFGHHHASDYGVSTTAGTHDPEAVLAIHGAMKTLNGFVIRRLRDRGVPAVPVHPLSVAHRDGEGTLSVPVGSVGTLLAEGFVPVLHGDLIAHAGEGTTVVSGDELVVSLARGIGADRVGLCSAVPGVLDDEGSVIDRIEAFSEVAAFVGASEHTDVSGGMAGKLRALLGLEVPASVFGPEDAPGFLAGEEPGTTVGGSG